MKSVTMISSFLCSFNVVEYFGTLFNIVDVRWASVKLEIHVHWGNGRTSTFLLLKQN